MYNYPPQLGNIAGAKISVFDSNSRLLWSGTFIGAQSMYSFRVNLFNLGTNPSNYILWISNFIQYEHVLNFAEIEFFWENNPVVPYSYNLWNQSVLYTYPNGYAAGCFDGNLNTFCQSQIPALSNPYMYIALALPFDKSKLLSFCLFYSTTVC